MDRTFGSREQLIKEVPLLGKMILFCRVVLVRHERRLRIELGEDAVIHTEDDQMIDLNSDKLADRGDDYSSTRLEMRSIPHSKRRNAKALAKVRDRQLLVLDAQCSRKYKKLIE